MDHQSVPNYFSISVLVEESIGRELKTTAGFLSGFKIAPWHSSIYQENIPAENKIHQPATC